MESRLRARTLGKGLACPHCPGRMLEPVRDEGVELDVCVRCGGLWLDQGELVRAVARYAPGRAESARIPDGLGARKGESERRCPRCEVALVEHALAPDNPVPVDVCARCHGIWLDHEELAFAQAGPELRAARMKIAGERGWGGWLFQLLSGMPIEFNFAPRRLPVVTFGLIALNVAVFLYQLAVPEVTQSLGLVPAQAGELRWCWQLVAHNFLHSGWIHLLGNMYFLWILGDNVEDVLGALPFLAFYFVTAIGSGLADSLTPVDPEVVRIGASGAVSGILAAYALLFRRAKLTFMLAVFQFKLGAPVYMAIWVVFNVVGLAIHAPGVAFEGHLGGFACGLAIALVAYRPLLRRDPLLRLLNGERLPLPKGR